MGAGTHLRGYPAGYRQKGRRSLQGIHNCALTSTALRSRHSGVDADSIGTGTRPRSRLVFIPGEEGRVSHDRDHDDNPGHDERGDTLCLVQGDAKSHDPEDQW